MAVYGIYFFMFVAGLIFALHRIDQRFRRLENRVLHLEGLMDIQARVLVDHGQAEEIR